MTDEEFITKHKENNFCEGLGVVLPTPDKEIIKKYTAAKNDYSRLKNTVNQEEYKKFVEEYSNIKALKSSFHRDIAKVLALAFFVTGIIGFGLIAGAMFSPLNLNLSLFTGVLWFAYYMVCFVVAAKVLPK